MPRPPKGPRLFLRERRGRAPVYVVLDTGGVEIGTGCGPEERAGAEAALARYIAQKHKSAVGTHDPGQLPIADTLNFYAAAKDPGEDADARKRDLYDRMLGYVHLLILFFGTKTISEVRAAVCRDYVRWRTHRGDPAPGWPERLPRAVSDQTARRELVVLSAAVNHYHAEYTLDMVPVVTLPAMAPTKRRSLERDEVAALLAGALGFYRNEGGQLCRHRKSTRAIRKRTARFILIGVYSGTRNSAICSASWLPRIDGPWIDVDRGVLHRRGAAEEETSKKRPPARIPPRLLAHLRRWREADLAEGIQWVMSVGGRKFAGKMRKGWVGARTDGRTLCADLPEEATPHWLRHTTGTWLARGGISAREGADFLGMTEDVFEEVYYHQSPDFQAGIGAAFDAAKAKRVATENGTGTRPRLPKKPPE